MSFSIAGKTAIVGVLYIICRLHSAASQTPVNMLSHCVGAIPRNAFYLIVKEHGLVLAFGTEVPLSTMLMVFRRDVDFIIPQPVGLSRD